ncbi:hypothetical protein L7F22_058150 [Adiantum nelumboides]|nr:hypothetical protein [Adiantum nelumboides]
MGARKVRVAVFSDLDCVKLQCKPSEHSSVILMVMQLAIELAGKPYDLSTSSNASRIIKRLADGCSKGPRCIFSALDCVKLQRGPFEHPSASRITIRLALKLFGKSYDLPESSNASRLTIWLADECSEGPRYVFSALDCVKLQRGPFEHPSTSCITIWLDKPYDLPTNSNASQLTIRLADGCSKGPRCVFNALDYVKSQRGPFKHSSISRMHPSASRMVMRLAIELAGNPYDLSAVSNANRITKWFADGCLEGSCCIFSALDCVKLQRGPFEHPSASRITIRLALELVDKTYDLSDSFNANRLTMRLADGCSEGPRCVFSALNYVKLQRGPSEHPSAIRITIRLALELVSKPYDLSASSNASQLTIRLADGCSKDPRCAFSALNYVKSQREPSKHSSVSRMVMKLALELAGKSSDLSTSSNASRITKRLADGCSAVPRCVFSALDCVKLERVLFKHTLTNRITIRLALEFIGNLYDFLSSSNLAVELAGKPYDLSTSSNASRIIKRLADGCSEGPPYIFSALDCVKLQRGTFEHASASRITIRLALELAGKPYDLPASSNASRRTIRLADGCSKEHPSASCMVMRLAIELLGKAYDLSTIFNASRITKRFANECSEGSCCVLNALDYVKLQRGSFEHPSASRITIRLALELSDKPYDLPADSNTSRLTMRLADGCSKGPRCVFSALDYVKLQRGPSEHPLASRITIRFALELVGKPYDLSASSNASRLTIRLTDGCSKGPCYVFSALNYVKSQRGPSKHSSVSRMVMRLALELAGKSSDLSTSSNASRITKRLADRCSTGPRCVFSALDCVKLERGPFKHTSASRITIRLSLELVGKPYDLLTSSNASLLTIRIADGCLKCPRCNF